MFELYINLLAQLDESESFAEDEDDEIELHDQPCSQNPTQEDSASDEESSHEELANHDSVETKGFPDNQLGLEDHESEQDENDEQLHEAREEGSEACWLVVFL